MRIVRILLEFNGKINTNFIHLHGMIIGILREEIEIKNLHCLMVNDVSSSLKVYTSDVRVCGQSWKSHLSATNDSLALYCSKAQQSCNGRGCVRIPISSFEASAVVSRLYRFIPTVPLPLRGGIRSRQSILHEANFFTLKKTLYHA